jgi:hypothetical protein
VRGSAFSLLASSEESDWDIFWPESTG